MSVGGKPSIGIVGFSTQEAALLEIFFNGNRAEGFQLVPAERAQALLIDLSDTVSRRQVEKWLRRNGERPFIAVVESTAEKMDGKGKKGLRLTRPLSMDALQRALAELQRQLDGGASSSPSPEPQPDPERRRAAVFAQWQARKERSSQAQDAWKGEKTQRQGEALRSRFSVKRDELNHLILEAQNQLEQKQRSSAPSGSGPAPRPAKGGAQGREPRTPAELPTPRLSAEMVQQCCGNLPDVDLDSATERRRVYFSLDGLLLPWIKRSIEVGNASGKPQQIVGVPGALFYLPADKAFLVTIDSDLLLQLTRTRFGFEEISLLEREPDIELPKGRRVAADELLWQLALFTARGRLPDTLSAEEPRLLKSMPDFERLLETPHARSIAELWQSQRLSAQDVASLLGVPQRFVFSFLVAADAIGLYCQ